MREGTEPQREGGNGGVRLSGSGGWKPWTMMKVSGVRADHQPCPISELGSLQRNHSVPGHCGRNPEPPNPYQRTELGGYDHEATGTLQHPTREPQLTHQRSRQRWDAHRRPRTLHSIVGRDGMVAQMGSPNAP